MFSSIQCLMRKDSCDSRATPGGSVWPLCSHFRMKAIKDPVLLLFLKYAAIGVFAYKSITSFLINIILCSQECSFGT